MNSGLPFAKKGYLLFGVGSQPPLNLPRLLAERLQLNVIKLRVKFCLPSFSLAKERVVDPLKGGI